jgi:lipopolysaccharide transport system permease protein
MGTGIALLGMGVVWSTLFSMDLKRFFPYLSSGYVIWMFFSGVLTESCNAFADGHAQSIQKNIDIPRFVHVMRLMARNVLLFFHAFSIVVIGIAVFRVAVTPATLLAIPGFALATLTLLPVALIFAIIGTRYRDFGPAVGAMLTVIFFVTPVMWQTEQLGDKVYLAQINPLTHLVAIIRDPLLGMAPPWFAWIFVAASCALLWPIALALFARTRHRIVYWL